MHVNVLFTFTCCLLIKWIAVCAMQYANNSMSPVGLDVKLTLICYKCPQGIFSS